MVNRNYLDPEYKKARIATRKRDGNRCKRCKSTKKLQVHHIKPFYLHPELKNVVSNLITLCKVCHSMMWQKEQDYEAYCLSLLGANKASIHDILERFGDVGE